MSDTIPEQVKRFHRAAPDKRRFHAQIRLPVGKVSSFKFPIKAKPAAEMKYVNRKVSLINSKQLRNLQLNQTDRVVNGTLNF